jgi:hypothetical protein
MSAAEKMAGAVRYGVVPEYVTNGVSFLQTTKIIVLTAPIVMVMPFLHTGCKRASLLPETEEPMITIEFITALFYEVDEQLRPIPKHPEAHLWPSEVVTLGLLHALKGVGNRPFYRWLTVRRESAL